MLSRLLPLLLLLALLPSALPAQRNGTTPVRYRFRAGDSVLYRVHTVDSIGLFDVQRHVVARQRISVVSYRCDSVLADGSYVMTWRYIAYSGSERVDDHPPVSRETHPWVGRTATFRMKPSGERTTMYRWDRTSATSPGGPLEPLPLPWLGEDSLAPRIPGTSGHSGHTWLFENSFPPTLWEGTLLRVLSEERDTAGRRVLPIELNIAGTVVYATRQGEDSITTQAVIQGGGTTILGKKEGYPLGGEMTILSRLKLWINNGREEREVEGRHTIATAIELLWPKPLRAPKRGRKR